MSACFFYCASCRMTTHEAHSHESGSEDCMCGSGYSTDTCPYR